MRITPRELSSGFVLALLTATFLIAPSSKAVAQSSTRSFQMALWGAKDDGDHTDIKTFDETQEPSMPQYDGKHRQPPGRSIRVNFNWKSPVDPDQYDWSRIVAVMVDEPYNYLDLDGSPNTDDADSSGAAPPCRSGSGAQNTMDAVIARDQELAVIAAQIKAVAPAVRFWVNLTNRNLEWMTECYANNNGLTIIDKPYIDVISLDEYSVSFGSIYYAYDWLIFNRAKPDQQIALVPGTFHTSGNPSEAVRASYLEDYFEYADYMNQSCDLPQADRGYTGSFDRCPVWIVLGWLAHDHTESPSVTYLGEQHSALISAAWEVERALPLRPGLVRQLTRAQLLPTLLRPLLNN